MSAPGERPWLIDRESSSAENALSAPIAELPPGRQNFGAPTTEWSPAGPDRDEVCSRKPRCSRRREQRPCREHMRRGQPSNHKAIHCPAQSAGDPAAWKCDGHCLTALSLRPACLRLVLLNTSIPKNKPFTHRHSRRGRLVWGCPSRIPSPSGPDTSSTPHPPRP